MGQWGQTLFQKGGDLPAFFMPIQAAAEQVRRKGFGVLRQSRERVHLGGWVVSGISNGRG